MLLLGFVFLCAVLGDRLVLPVSILGSGALPLVPLMAPVVALLTILALGTWRSLGFVYSPAFVVLVLPWILMTTILPLLGVLFNGYAMRTIWDSTGGTTAVSFMIIGAALSVVRNRAWAAWLIVAIVLQLAYSLGQMAFISGFPSGDLFEPLARWDLTFQEPGTDLLSRSTGLYLNPNELGTWAALATVLAVVFMSAKWRPVGVVMAVALLILSQARGATVAVVVAIALGAFLALMGGRLSSMSLRSAAITVVLLLAVVPVVLLLGSQGDAVGRFTALFDVLSEGTAGDANLSGRVELWAGVVELSADYPAGTWGPPGVLLEDSVDSAWFGHLAQGSIVYVVFLGLLMLAPFTIKRAPQRYAIWLVGTVVAVASLTQNPLGEPVSVLFWALLGAGLQWQTATGNARHRSGPRGRLSTRSAPTRASVGN